ncbi:hypothetical protein F5884DRAFT_900010 [Xylogone sp. PMI_703]|nr:hypothetical protein F5884DRAFT_900010 [Xylogone sp. PMI_703]
MPFCKLDHLAAGGNRSQQRYVVDQSKLKIKALKICRISKVYPKLAWGSFENLRGARGDRSYDLPTYLDWLWIEFVEDGKSCNQYRTGCSIRVAFSLTITAGLRRWASSQDFIAHEKAFTKFSECLFKDAATTFQIRKNYRPTILRSAHTSILCECFQEDSFYEIRMQGGSEAGQDPDKQPEQQDSEDYIYFQRAVQSACNNRCLFVTETGYLGIGPHVIGKECPDTWDEELGVFPELSLDENSSPYEIWVVPGARTPFVLQQQGGSYLLIGECYVHGLMEGQALVYEEYSYKWQEIELC